MSKKRILIVFPLLVFAGVEKLVESEKGRSA